ncbi:hypothetical protein [Nocardia niigatensis]|uniref:hypothetical protein n=1 Tax=Nocardia niigatensis TaxID=209249 RepID=UPI0002F67814|nr:hypothetical protein [Nocardia niigatensis]
MDQQQINVTRREFDQIDADHDGFISFDEAMNWGMAQGRNAGDIIGRHLQQDRVSEDGQISFEEFLRYKELISY